MSGSRQLATLIFITLSLLIAGVCTGSPARAERERVVAAVARDLYPEYLVDADDRPGGFAIDMMEALARRAGLSVTFVTYDTWSELLAALERGDADVVPLLSVTPQREGRMLFTRPALTSAVSLFVRQDSDAIRGWGDLAGRRVGVIASGVSGQLLADRYKNARIVPHGRLQDAVFALLSGEVDALVSFPNSVWKVSEKARLTDRIKIVGDPLTEVSRAVAVRRDLPALRDSLDSTLAELLNSPEYGQLYAKWYTVEPSFWNAGRVAWLSGAFTALLLLSMLFWQSLTPRGDGRRRAASVAGTSAGVQPVGFPSHLISRACGLVAIVLGATVLLGWAFELTAIKTGLPGLFAMQPWAATAITLAGGALLAATAPGRIAAAISMALAGSVLIVGLQSLLQYATGLDFGTDFWLFPTAVRNQPGHPHPGRVAEATSIALILLGAMLLLARVERVWAARAFSIIGTVGLLLMAAPLVGYLIGAGTLQSVAFLTPIALHAALGLIIIFVGALALRRETGWMALLSGDLPGAASARMLLPVVVAGPLLLAWLFNSGKQAGLYGSEFEIGLVTLSTMALLATSLLWNGARLDRLDMARRAGAEALRRNEERYRALVEGQPDPICQFLPDTTLTFVNRAYAEFYGREPEHLIGRRWLDFAPRDERPRFLEELASFTPENPERHEETRSTRADHEVRWYLCHLYGFFDDAGTIVSFQTFGTDITERKRAEEALRESEQRVRAQLMELETLYQTAPIGLAVYDRDLRFVRINETLADINGLSVAEHLGRHVWDVVPRLREAVDPRFRKVLATGEAVVFEVSGETPRAPSVQRDWVAHYYPLKGPDGSVTAIGAIVQEVTERKQAERALRESEARYRTVGEAIPYGVWVCNPAGAVEYVSQSFLELVGKTIDEVKPRGWLDRLPPEDVKRTLNAWHDCVRTGADWTWEHRVKGKDGIWRTILSLGRPVRDERGRITSWGGFNLDITDRKRWEEALGESEARMRALLDASQDEILLMSTEGTVLAINKAAQRRLARRTGGSTPVGVRLERLLPQDQVEARMAIVRQVAATARLTHCDLLIRSRWFEFWFYPVFQPDRPVSEVAVYAREITEQKKSQADLNKLFQAIQQSPMSVVITDRNGNIEYVNPKFTDVTGYTMVEATGQNPRILKSGHTSPEQYAELWETISSGGVWRGEFLNKKKNGELFWELASIAPVKVGDKVTNFVAVKEDITVRKEMEEQLRQSQKMEALGQLTGGIAHDFNNLLAIIMGNLQLLGERLGSDEKIRELLEDALWSARRGGELTHRLLAFARKQPLKPTVIDLNEVIRGITELLRRTLGMRIQIEESLASDLWKAFADRGELERALVNLAVNSRDAMRSAGTLTLETRNAVLDEEYAEQCEEVAPGDYVLVAVTDNGTGMPPEIVQRVFEPFFTTKEVGQGSGLGLSMVYGFAKQSGGHVSIYSRVGLGTCVKLYLPRAPSPPAQRREGFPDVSPGNWGDKVVLVVEDEPKLRKVAVRMLDRLGLKSIQAETAKDALAFLANAHVDVLFTDIELPGGMNGAELADLAHSLYPDLKLLFTTGYAREAILHQPGLHEQAPWLLKPYSHQELAHELKALFTSTLH